jgi:hypothetical protein
LETVPPVTAPHERVITMTTRPENYYQQVPERISVSPAIGHGYRRKYERIFRQIKEVAGRSLCSVSDGYVVRAAVEHVRPRHHPCGHTVQVQASSAYVYSNAVVPWKFICRDLCPFPTGVDSVCSSSRQARTAFPFVPVRLCFLAVGTEAGAVSKRTDSFVSAKRNGDYGSGET